MKIPLKQVVMVFGGFVFHFIFMGIPQSFGVIYSELLSAYEISEGELGWVASLHNGMFFGAGIISGIIISALGACKTSILGTLLMSIGMVTSGFVTSSYLLYVTYGLTAGFGASILTIAAYVMLIDEESANRRSVIVVVASSGGGIGNIVLPPLSSWLVDLYGWRGCFVLLGGVCLQGLVISALLYSGPNKLKVDTVKQNDDANHLPNTMVHRCKNYFSFFNRLYFSYLVATTLSKVAFFVPYTFLYNMMITRGQTRATASLTLSLAGIGSIVSRLLVGFIGDFKCCHRIYYYIFSMLFSGAITMACVHFKEDWQFLMYGFMYGFSAAIFAFLVGVLVADFSGVQNVGSGLGFTLTVGGISASIGTPIGGWIADVTGSYNGSFYFCGAFFIAGGLVASLIPAMWHCRPSKQLKITDQGQEKCPTVEIYRIENITTDFKTSN